MAKKEKKQRTLSEAEKKRLESFEKISADMEEQGYNRRDLIIGMKKATLSVQKYNRKKRAGKPTRFFCTLIFIWSLRQPHCISIRSRP